MTFQVTLTKYEIQFYNLKDVGVEVANTTQEYLEQFGLDHGVVISKTLSPRMQRYDLKGLIISEVDGKKISSVSEVKQIIEQYQLNFKQ